MWLKSANIKCTHGFSTRHGGVSKAPYHSLNFGGSGDFTENILQNRLLALQQLGIAKNYLCSLNQVHGNTVCVAKPGYQTGDALVTNLPNHTLAIGVADCYPILFYDEINHVIGAAHAGWRGRWHFVETWIVSFVGQRRRLLKGVGRRGVRVTPRCGLLRQ